MAWAADDIIEFTLKGDYGGVVGTRNVFHYAMVSIVDMDDDPFAALGFAAQTLYDKLLEDLLPVTAVKMGYSALDAKVLTGDHTGLQNTTVPAGRSAGDRASDALPPTDAWGFRYQGAGGVERNGYKRFCGVCELDQADGVATGAVLTDLTALSATLRADVDILDNSDPTPLTIGIMTPVIVKKVAGGLDPEDITVINFWRPVGVLFYGIGTQKTRAFGRGL